MARMIGMTRIGAAFVVVVLAGACGGSSDAGLTGASSGGATSGGGVSNLGGEPSTGGTPNSGGVPGTGGAAGIPSAGGKPSTGGAAGVAGQPSTGGTVGTGGAAGAPIDDGGVATGGMAGAPADGGINGKSCDALAANYLTALADAKACAPNGSDEPCTKLVSSDIADCGCGTFVNPANVLALQTLDSLKADWAKKNCKAACPLSLCVEPNSADCSPSGSGPAKCEDSLL